LRIRTLIVDDEPLARRRIRRLLDSDPDVEVIGECGEGTSAAAALEQHTPDLVFLDVQMPGADGFDVVGAAPAGRRPVVVFITAYDEYAVRAFEVHAVDYLLKPIDRARFAEALERAKTQVELHRAGGGEHGARMATLLEELRRNETYLTRLLVRAGESFIFLEVDQIDWIRAAGKYVELHVGPKTHLLRERLHVLEARLDPNRYVRTQRSAIVNVRRVKELQPAFHGNYVVILHDGTEIPLTQAYRAKLQRLFSASP
jgi:two-component system, LytTR family, response regulator